MDENNLLYSASNAALGQLGTYNSFTGHNITFESLRSSGRFEAMWDLETRINHYGLEVP